MPAKMEGSWLVPFSFISCHLLTHCSSRCFCFFFVFPLTILFFPGPNNAMLGPRCQQKSSFLGPYILPIFVFVFNCFCFSFFDIYFIVLHLSICLGRRALPRRHKQGSKGS